MANDNKGRWWMKHNHIAFDKIIRRSILFRDLDPDRIYMMGISEGAYGTEAIEVERAVPHAVKACGFPDGARAPAILISSSHAPSRWVK